MSNVLVNSLTVKSLFINYQPIIYIKIEVSQKGPHLQKLTDFSVPPPSPP